MIYKDINNLVSYGISKNLIKNQDKIYVINQLLDLFQLDDYEDREESSSEICLEEILKKLTDYAFSYGIIQENSITHRDLFDTKIMGILVPRPSWVISTFYEEYKKSPRKATDFYYKFNQDINYIRKNRIEKDVKWTNKTTYGDMDITINLSKPEKDPKEITAAKKTKQSGYPKCLLCKENEGYRGRINHPARQNHRIIPITINKEKWGFQYSPYVYYNEHCIVFNGKHTPMKIEKETFRKLFDFVKEFPHYVVGSNADLPIVGGSILTHDHFQGGNFEFAMAKAPMENNFLIKGYEAVEVGIVKWPMSVIRIRNKDENKLIELGDLILRNWREYSDEKVFIYAFSKGEAHNTITPIARKVEDTFELDLVLRNNITSREHPFGVFHPHSELHNIKKENIGLIEVMGLAVLPSRLKEEMELLSEYIVENKDIASNETIQKHKDWVDGFRENYISLDKEHIDEIIKTEIGMVFTKVLEQAGVFKRDVEGQEAFKGFIKSVNK